MLTGGVVISDVAYVFAVPLCQFSTSLPYIWHVECLAGNILYPTSVVVRYFLGEVLGFDALLYCVCAFETMFMFVCLNRLVSFLTFGLRYVNVGFFYLLMFVCELFAVFEFLVLLCVYSGGYSSALWFVLFPILSVVLLLSVFCWYDSGMLQFCVRSCGWIRSWWWCLSVQVSDICLLADWTGFGLLRVPGSLYRYCCRMWDWIGNLSVFDLYSCVFSQELRDVSGMLTVCHPRIWCRMLCSSYQKAVS